MLKVGIIPCYKTPIEAINVVRDSIKFLDKVICVDDCCPFGTGSKIESYFDNENIFILYNKKNKGVGGAMKTGIKFALDMGADIIVKIDSDGQMPANLIPALIKPIQEGKAEFSKGNRFRNSNVISKMKKIGLKKFNNPPKKIIVKR